MIKLIASLSVLSLAACSAEPAAPAVDDVEEPDAPSVERTDSRIEDEAPPMPPASLGLQPLSQVEIAVGNLGGELGCVFSREPTGEALFIATSVEQGTEPARGLFKTGSETIRVAHEGTGFAALSQGGSFTAEDTELVIVRLAAEPLVAEPPVAPEAPLYRARLSIDHLGDMATEQGFWRCGP
ncbi:hypothetical protein [Aurantiacibacter gilvus]|uniref:DUF4232 domain-containing protein n=1 Tax=Aurantiacibacter gilvus TaxID=3139141 RepID=A0ABU9I9P7_9SPHN